VRKRVSAGERKRRQLQGYLDRLRRIPNKTPQDVALQQELQDALDPRRKR
jgi:hypothetical protein